MRRIPELDALRGLSALLIVALHLGLGPTCPAFARAVDLFFVLSGYLITATILEHRAAPRFLRNFYARRALRIWPIYYLALLGFAFLINPIRDRPHRLDGLWAHLTYTQNLPYYWGDRIPPFSPWFRHTWTLAIEEQFYLLWPLLAMRAGRRWLAVAALALIAGPIAARTQWPPWLLLTRCDGFAFGALLAIVPAGSFARHRGRWSSAFALLGIAASAAIVSGDAISAALVSRWPILGGPLGYSVSETAYNALCGAIVGLTLSQAGRPALRPLRFPALCYVGTISYGLYLYHIPLFGLISADHYEVACTDSMTLDLAKLLASFALAIASWELLEKPILRLKHRYAYASAAKRPASAAGVAAHPPSVARGPHAAASEVVEIAREA